MKGCRNQNTKVLPLVSGAPIVLDPRRSFVRSQDCFALNKQASDVFFTNRPVNEAFNSGVMVVGKLIRSREINMKRRALSLLCNLGNHTKLQLRFHILNC
jgi:hypothetical protein